MEPLATPSNTVTMGTIIGGKFFDDYAVQYNGTDNAHYINAPSFASDTAGAIAVDVIIPTLLSENGGIRFLGLLDNDTTAGNLFVLYPVRADTVYGDTKTHFAVQGWVGGGWARAVVPAGITAGQKYRVLFQSDGKIYIDGADAGPLIQHLASPRQWTGQWMKSALRTGAPTNFFIGGGIRPNGSTSSFGKSTANNLIYYNAPLTAAEALADHNGGVAFDRRSNADLNTKLVEFWRFDENGNAEVNAANNLTAYNTPTYVAP